ncbi:hypothetical protein J8F10_24025 [Gemmata sp. G18]|uniref:Sensor histidine kinase n=1 Tax=Gemmata palustris TaxID=2822762 RepID=A0ABS5BXE5_9BACT|nr:hypothetical protein [Gemmata palustris]MBP3958328.1 hypothetical protein [Gemmata palustris]
MTRVATRFVLRTLMFGQLVTFLTFGLVSGVAIKYLVNAAQEQARLDGYAQVILQLPPAALTQLTVKDSM